MRVNFGPASQPSGNLQYAPPPPARHEVLRHQTAPQCGRVCVETREHLEDLLFGVLHPWLKGFEHMPQHHQELVLLLGKGFHVPSRVEEGAQHLAVIGIQIHILGQIG